MFEVDAFIEAIQRANGEGQGAVGQVLARAVSEPHQVLRRLGEPREAGVEVLHRAADLTILNIVWAPLMVLLPHNHNMWAAIGVYSGREDNVLWERARDTAAGDAAAPRIRATRAASLSVKDMFPLGKEGIHSVVNPSEQFTGAIHIYGGDFFAPGRSEWDPDTLQERPFDVDGLQDRFRRANARVQAGRPNDP
jgi:predicted metal-dependent enzyme (double-stranded beta helix superfamily)